MKQVDTNGFWSIKNNPISKVGVFPYLGRQIDPSLEPDKVYMVLRPAEELFNEETLESFNENPVPLVDDHTMIGDEYTPPEQKGIDGVVNNIHQEGDRLVGDISIYSKAMKNKIANGKKDLSMGYFCTYDLSEGVYNGEHYDAVQRNIRSNHIALVDRGRCGHDVRVFDKWCFDCAIVEDVEFIESEHPRHKDGKFAPKGEGESTNKVERKNLDKEYIKNQKAISSLQSVNSKLNLIEKEIAARDYKDTIREYTSENYLLVNEKLYQSIIKDAPLDDDITSQVKKICSHMEPMGFDTRLYRITKSFEFENILPDNLLKEIDAGDFSNIDEIKNHLINQSIINPCFISTTENNDYNYLAGVDTTSNKHISLVLNINSDVMCNKISNFSSYPQEKEVLLPPGTKFKITDANVVNQNVDGEDRDMIEIVCDVETPDVIKNDIQKIYKRDWEQEYKDYFRALKDTNFYSDYGLIEDRKDLLMQYKKTSQEIEEIMKEIQTKDANSQVSEYLIQKTKKILGAKQYVLTQLIKKFDDVLQRRGINNA